MAQVVYAEDALADLDRVFDFLADKDPDAASRALLHVRESIELLERHPLIGRPAESGLRELLISYGKSGYAALYEFLEADDVVLVYALRYQREAGYRES